jgi:asparagine synthase (glutamine-hydrolysing)
MANSLEVRSPLMDHKVAEFAAKLPVNMKVRGRNLRYIQYKLLKRYLPEEVLQRPKQGFSSALPYMLSEQYRKLFKSVLTHSELAEEGILQQSEVNRLLAEHLSKKKDHGNRLWLLLNAEVWYRMKIKQTQKDDLYALINAD